ncbi:hypothetical protein ABFA07_004492 [Porites harrisoni]
MARCFYKLIYLRFLYFMRFLWFVAFLPYTDCGSITWYEPLPVVTETDSTVTSVADSTQLVRGADGFLSWNFTLTGEQFTSAVLAWKTELVVTIQPAFGVVSVLPGFKDRFYCDLE